MLYTMYTFVSLSVTSVFVTTVQHAGMRFGVKLWASVSLQNLQIAITSTPKVLIATAVLEVPLHLVCCSPMGRTI